MNLSGGTRIGPYEILSSIGSGGMGEVWNARDTRLGRIVAIKKVKEQHGDRFKREAKSIAASVLSAEMETNQKSEGEKSWEAHIC